MLPGLSMPYKTEQSAKNSHSKTLTYSNSFREINQRKKIIKKTAHRSVETAFDSTWLISVSLECEMQFKFECYFLHCLTFPNIFSWEKFVKQNKLKYNSPRKVNEWCKGYPCRRHHHRYRRRTTATMSEQSINQFSLNTSTSSVVWPDISFVVKAISKARQSCMQQPDWQVTYLFRPNPHVKLITATKNQHG